jgi:hypothetical protein
VKLNGKRRKRSEKRRRRKKRRPPSVLDNVKQSASGVDRDRFQKIPEP